MSTSRYGITRLHQAIQGVVRDHAPAPSTDLVLGEILDDLSLRLDAYPNPWPPNGYAVLEQFTDALTLPQLGTTDVVALTDSGGTTSHSHVIERTGAFLPLAPGNRVLAVVVFGNTFPIVLGRIRWAPVPSPVEGP